MLLISTLAVLSVTGYVRSQETQYVWNLLKIPLTAEEIQVLLASKSDQFPTYNTVPDTDSDCSSKAQPGFYADVSTGCQVFHRCDFNGNMTSYLCVNSTVFNQITLVCDFWFNVDCQRSKEFENFANSRLYTNQQLFDTPPANWTMPGSGADTGSGAAAPQPEQTQEPNTAEPVVVNVSPVPAPTKKATPKPAAVATKQAAMAAGIQASGAAAAGGNGGAAQASVGPANSAQGRLTITVMNQPQNQAPNP